MSSNDRIPMWAIWYMGFLIGALFYTGIFYYSASSIIEGTILIQMQWSVFTGIIFSIGTLIIIKTVRHRFYNLYNRSVGQWKIFREGV